MKRTMLVFAALFLVVATLLSQECGGDHSRFTKAKLAIAKRALAQSKARLETCSQQPAAEQALCAEWAEAGNKAADDIEATAFAEIDKLAAAH